MDSGILVRWLRRTAARSGTAGPSPPAPSPTPPAVVVLTVLAYRLRSPGLGPATLWLDDAWVAAGARMPLSDALDVGLTSFGFAFSFRFQELLGLGPRAYQLPAFAVAVMTPALVVVVLRERRLHRTAAIAAAATMVWAPINIEYSTRVKQYTSDTALMVVLAWLAWRLLDEPGSRRRWAAFAAVWAAATWWSGTLLLAGAAVAVVPGVALLVRQGLVDAARTLTRPALGAGAALGLFYLVVVRRSVGGPLKNFWRDRFLDLGADGWSGTGDRLRTVFESWIPPGPIGATWLVLGAIAVLVLARRWWELALVTAPFVAALAAAFAHVQPIGTGRTDSYLLGPLTLLAGLAAHELVDAVGSVTAVVVSRSGAVGRSEDARVRARFATTVTGLVVVVAVIRSLGTAAYTEPRYPVENIAPAVAHIEANVEPGDVVLLYPSARFTYALAHDGDVRVAQPPDWSIVVSYLVEFDDSRLGFPVVVPPPSRAEPWRMFPWVDRAFDRGDRVWFLAQHMHPADFPAIFDEVEARGGSPTYVYEAEGVHLTLWKSNQG